MKNININAKVLGLACSIVLAIMIFPSCKKKSNEEELITTVKLVLKDSATLESKIYRWQDLDGAGGNNPSLPDTLKLGGNRTYYYYLVFINESDASKVVDITEEIKSEGKDHLICFADGGSGNLKFIATDSDGTLPIGIDGKIYVGNNGNGTIKMVLHHQPGIKTGDCNKGETDAEVDFIYRILQ